MVSTYTPNNGIEKIGTGEQSAAWGATTNTNFDLIDNSLDGQVTVTLPATGSSGAPNNLPVTDGASSNGRKRYVSFADSGDLGGTAFVQLTPNSAQKVIIITNSLSGGRSINLFQGTYNASNDYTLPNGDTAIVKFDGAGTGAVVTRLISDIGGRSSVNINGGTIDGTTIGATTPAAGTFTSVDANGDVTSASNTPSFQLEENDTGAISRLFLSASTTALQAGSAGGGGTGTIRFEGYLGGQLTALQARIGGAVEDVLTTAGIDGTVIGATTPAAVTTSALVATTADINGGNIDGTIIGATSPTAGTFTSVSVASNTVRLTSAGIDTIAGTALAPSYGFSDEDEVGMYRSASNTIGFSAAGVLQATISAVTTTINDLTATTADINGGTIDGTTIGATTPAAGAFVVLDAIGADSSTTGLTIENTAGEQLRQYFTDGTAGADFNLDYNGTGVSDIVITSAGAVTIPGFVGEKYSLGEIHRDTTAAGATAWSPASTAARLIIVELIGGGAGAGGAKSNVSGNVAVSGGGGAGARAVLAIDLSTHTAPFSYTIGAGGGGTGIGSNGNNGGDTTITISATTSTAGGGVGSGLNNEDSDPNGRSGGAGGANATLTAITGASVILDEYGEAGELGFGVPSVSVTGTGFGVGGRGGGGFDRANSITNNNNNGNDGSAGRNPGDGGGGASSTGTNASANTGGDGADGSVVIYVYY